MVLKPVCVSDLPGTPKKHSTSSRGLGTYIEPTTTRMATSRKNLRKRCVFVRMWSGWNPCVLLVETQNGAAATENSKAVPKKIKRRITIRSGLPWSLDGDSPHFHRESEGGTAAPTWDKRTGLQIWEWMCHWIRAALRGLWPWARPSSTEASSKAGVTAESCQLKKMDAKCQYPSFCVHCSTLRQAVSPCFVCKAAHS